MSMYCLAAYLQDRSKIQNMDQTRKFSKMSKELLMENDIKVDTVIPRKKTMMKNLRVSYETVGNRALNQKYFKDLGEIRQVDSSLTTIKYGREHLFIYDGRHFIYENNKETSALPLTKEQAEDIAKDFLSALSYPTDDLKLVNTKEVGNEWHLLYTMMYRGDYVESTYTKMTIAGGEVKKMDRLWLNILEEGQNQNILPPAAQVILTLLDDTAHSGKTIVSIEPCYFFSPEKQGTVEGYTKSLYGRATPAWRLLFSDGEEFVIDNQ